MLTNIIQMITSYIKMWSKKNMEGNKLLRPTIIIRIRMSLSIGRFRGKVLITTLCSDTICFANKHYSGCQREMVSHLGWGTLNGVSDAAEWAPVSPKSLQLLRCIHNTMYYACILPRFNSCLRECRLCYASFCKQLAITAKSATPLIIAQRSPCVEPNCGFLWVSVALRRKRSHL